MSHSRHYITIVHEVYNTNIVLNILHNNVTHHSPLTHEVLAEVASEG